MFNSNFQYIYIVRQLGITLPALVTTAWNSKVDVTLWLNLDF